MSYFLARFAGAKADNQASFDAAYVEGYKLCEAGVPYQPRYGAVLNDHFEQGYYGALCSALHDVDAMQFEGVA